MDCPRKIFPLSHLSLLFLHRLIPHTGTTPVFLSILNNKATHPDLSLFHFFVGLKRSPSIYSAADPPDLPFRTRERADVAHLDHCGDEVFEEDGSVGGVGANDGVGGAVVEELLVGLEESPSRDEVSVVSIIEGCRRTKVNGRQVIIAAG